MAVSGAQAAAFQCRPPGSTSLFDRQQIAMFRLEGRPEGSPGSATPRMGDVHDCKIAAANLLAADKGLPGHLASFCSTARPEIRVEI